MLLRAGRRTGRRFTGSLRLRTGGGAGFGVGGAFCTFVSVAAEGAGFGVGGAFCTFASAGTACCSRPRPEVSPRSPRALLRPHGLSQRPASSLVSTVRPVVAPSRLQPAPANRLSVLSGELFHISMLLVVRGSRSIQTPERLLPVWCIDRLTTLRVGARKILKFGSPRRQDYRSIRGVAFRCSLNNSTGSIAPKQTFF